MNRIRSLFSTCFLLLLTLPACCWECKKCRSCEGGACPIERRDRRDDREMRRELPYRNGRPMKRYEAASQDEEMSPQEDMRFEEEDY